MKIFPRFKKSRKKRLQQLQEKETYARDITEHSSQESLQCSDENEDVKNTTNDFYKNFKELIEGYESDKGEFIDMSQPRDASYATDIDFDYDSDTDERIEKVETTRLGEDVSLTSTVTHQDKIYYRSIKNTEVRGITLRQLRAIIPLIKRRCKKEKWTKSVYKDGKKTDDIEKVTLENATLYEIDEYIIRPFTKFSQKSFVETLPSTKGTQPPRWFVSHYWGESFAHTMACLEQMVQDFKQEGEEKGGGMTEDTPVWICAFANNQHNLDSDIADDPADTSFAKAMEIAEFRVISILDVNNKVYTRLWCMYELYLTLILSKGQGVLGIYTYHEHIHGGKRKAVGLIEGGATSDGSDYNYRQKFFPRERLLPFLSVSIQNAVASKDTDRENILNSLHGTYDALNDAIRGAVFSSQATLNLIYETGEKSDWDSALSALKKSSGKVFECFETQMLQISKEAMAQVFHHLPTGLEKLSLHGCPHGRVAMDALLDWLENDSTTLKKLWISDTTCIGGEIGGKECGERLAKFLAQKDCKIKYLYLLDTDLIGPRNFNTWIECLEKNQSLWSLHKKTLKEEASKFESLLSNKRSVLEENTKTKQKEANTVDNEVHMIEEFVLEESTAKTEQQDNEVQMFKEIVSEESNAAVGEKPTSNWLCGVVSCF